VGASPSGPSIPTDSIYSLLLNPLGNHNYEKTMEIVTGKLNVTLTEKVTSIATAAQPPVLLLAQCLNINNMSASSDAVLVV